MITKRCFSSFSLLICMMMFTVNLHADTNKIKGGEDFESFIKQFTNSAAFQLSRIKFPLKSPIILLSSDGETAKEFPFTQDNWPVLEDGVFVVERMDDDYGHVYVIPYKLDEDDHKGFAHGF